MAKPQLRYKSSKIFFNDPEKSDVQFMFKCGEKKPEVIYAHASVLYIECPKLFKLFISGQPHGSCTVVMNSYNNINVEVFKIFLELLYMGRTDNQLVLANYYELLDLCAFFDMPDILTILKKSLQNFTVDTLPTVLEICLKYDYKDTKIRAMEFVKSNYSAVLKSNGILKVVKEVPVELLQVENIMDLKFVDELEIVHFVVRYIDAHSDSGDQQRYAKFFQDIIRHIRFTSMTAVRFAECIDQYKNLLTADQSVEIFKEVCGFGKNTFGFSKVNRVAPQFRNRNGCYNGFRYNY